MLILLINLIITIILTGSVTLTFLRKKAPRLASDHTLSKW